MKDIARNCTTLATALILGMGLAGCTKELVKDDTRRDTLATSHCSGSDWVNDSTVAILPIPVVALLSPHTDVNEIKADDFLKRCGDSTQLINREVEVSRAACVPTFLTRIVTLGVWQWCPAHVTWKADVLPGSAQIPPDREGVSGAQEIR